LSELKVLKDPTAVKILTPVISSVGLLISIGAFAIWVAPKLLEAHLLKRLPDHTKENMMLGVMLSTSLVLIIAAKYAQSSYVLGTFLAGLCFCSSSHASTAWTRQVSETMVYFLLSVLSKHLTAFFPTVFSEAT
jgi:Kef-type K+ transport system membrane component KefB